MFAWRSITSARCKQRKLLVAALCLPMLAGCSSSTVSQQLAPSDIPLTPTVMTSATHVDTENAGEQVTATIDVTSAFPPVTGSDPSMRVAAFYYPWYGSWDLDGEWIHWKQAGATPPRVISSDYYPLLGAYSSKDPVVVAQHFAWLREAGVGVIITSWWGQGSREDGVVPILLDQAERYGLQVAFHIEPYSGRTSDRLLQDVEYIYNMYGEHPAFFRTKISSRWSPDDRSKGLFFVWLAGNPDGDSAHVEPSYWRAAIDAIHALPDGGLVIPDAVESFWVDDGHFDGLYNYATLSSDPNELFGWAQRLPIDSWYVPSVLPGFSARRIGYAEDAFLDRAEGVTYDIQWQAALDLGIEPAMITITSFNEWHEGSQIEPAQPGVFDEKGAEYASYAPDAPNAYLSATRRWVETFLAKNWPKPYSILIRIRTSSDWTTFGLTHGGKWIHPELISSSPEASFAWMEGDRFSLFQSLVRAEAGGEVEMVVDLMLIGLAEGESLEFQIERGGLGWTEVDLMVPVDGEPRLIETLRWYGQGGDGRNTRTFSIPADLFLGADGS